MKKKQTQIRKYATVIGIFLIAVVIGLLVFFYGIQRSVEKRSKTTMMNNVSRQSEHLKTILNLQYQYLDGVAEEIGKSGQLISKNNTNMLKSIAKHIDFELMALIEPDGTAYYTNGLVKNVSHRR